MYKYYTPRITLSNKSERPQKVPYYGVMKKYFGLLGLLLSPLSHADWMSEPQLQELKLSAPLTKLIQSKKTQPDSKLEVDGVLSYGQRQIAVTVKVRGHTNYLEEECPFPKLTLKFKDASSELTPFAGLKKIKLGTHCGQSTDPKTWHTPLHRIKNQISVVREAFAYDLIRTLGVTTLQSRLVDMTYLDTEKQTSTKKKALLLEADSEMAKRTKKQLLEFTELTVEGPTSPKLPSFSDAVNNRVDLTQSAEVLLTEALLGNHDSALRISRFDQSTAGGPGLYNIFILRDVKSAVSTPVPYDFDVSSAVSGRSSLEVEAPSLNTDILGGLDLIQYSILRRVQEIKAQVPPTHLGRAITKLLMNKTKAYAALKTYPMDVDGKERFQKMMDFFYLSITQYLDLPKVSAAKGFLVYHDQAMKSLCGKLPKGSV